LLNDYNCYPIEELFARLVDHPIGSVQGHCGAQEFRAPAQAQAQSLVRVCAAQFDHLQLAFAARYRNGHFQFESFAAVINLILKKKCELEK
jgi:hypothetical protein